MSTNAKTRVHPSRTAHRLLSTPNGTLFEILASPEEVGDGFCLIRGTVPPAVAVPLHSHSDLEPPRAKRLPHGLKRRFSVGRPTEFRQ